MRDYVEFTDGSRAYAKLREQPCVCNARQTCIYHARHRCICESPCDEKPCHTIMQQMIEASNERAVQMISLILADASEGTADPERLDDIARRAVSEAQSNVEGK